jgi:hypothetical protein
MGVTSKLRAGAGAEKRESQSAGELESNDIGPTLALY